MRKAEYPQLREFLSAYFHQDWDVEAEDADGCVALFISHEPAHEELLVIVRQIDEYLEKEGPEESISRGLYEKLGCEYLPSVASEWLIHVANLLRRALDGRRNNLPINHGLQK